jgi:hypothetical protein
LTITEIIGCETASPLTLTLNDGLDESGIFF